MIPTTQESARAPGQSQIFGGTREVHLICFGKGDSENPYNWAQVGLSLLYPRLMSLSYVLILDIPNLTTDSCEKSPLYSRVFWLLPTAP